MRKSRFVFSFLAAGVLTLTAQQQPEQQQQQSPSPSQASAPAGFQPLNPDVPMDAAAPDTYVIGAEDVIAVNVWKERDVSGQMIVRPDGKVTMPLIGDIVAAGRTPLQLKTEITEKLSGFLTRPEVMVSIQLIRSKKYYINGKVNRSGSFPLVFPTTILEALSGAGGFQQWAKTKKITILRDGGSTTLKFNYDEVTKGKKLEQNVYLQNGDMIIVP